MANLSVQEIRQQAADTFANSQWPRQSEEEWRRTDLSLIDFEDYKHTDISFTLKGKQISESFDSPGALELLAGSQSDNRIVSWNSAQYSAAAYVQIPAGLDVTEPQIISLNTGGDGKSGHAKVLIKAEKNSRAVVVIQYKAEGDFILNHQLEAVVEENAQLTVLLMQTGDEEALFFGNSRVRIQAYGNLHFFTAHLGSNFVKDRIQADLLADGAGAELRGVYFGHQDDHMDIRSIQNHFASHCTSHAVFKGTAKDEAYSIFQGMIHVDESAVKTDAYLTNKNIVLNDGARCDSIPSLNIETNDVRCSHGSTTGKINPEQIFYLESRGYSKEEAKKIILEGFFEEVMEALSEEQKETLITLIANRI